VSGNEKNVDLTIPISKKAAEGRQGKVNDFEALFDVGEAGSVRVRFVDAAYPRDEDEANYCDGKSDK